MSGMSDYLATAFLKYLTSQAAMPAIPTHCYLALFTTAPTNDAGASAVEPGSANGYARVAIETDMALPTGSGPTTDTNNATISFPAATGAGWGTIIAWGLYDAATNGNLLAWDYLGNDPWFAFTCTLASPGKLTAPGITAGSSPVLANGDTVIVSAEGLGGALPTGIAAGSFTVANLGTGGTDVFDVGTNTTAVGAGMVRKVTSQAVPAGVTASFAAGSFVLAAS